MKEITVQEATHANRLGYSDVTPFEIISKKTDCKIIIRQMDAELDPNWKPECHVGGFCCNVSNQDSQEYTYTSETLYREIAVRLNKNGQWKDVHGNRYQLSLTPFKFYDYNF